ncbi:MAG: carboxypeptidase-like regulatory domain-containing protein, partial [Muribaculaceae bacterium]|nr:carboxypeptidase-like regulatory domain-containing protein [Muribaculaceae bacterium]
MKRTILLVILWGLAFSCGYSRRITGRVVDVDKEPLEFANVTVFVGGNAVGGSVTDRAGLFCIETSDECESIRVSYVGYEDTVMSLKPDDSKSIELGDLTLV